MLRVFFAVALFAMLCAAAGIAGVPCNTLGFFVGINLAGMDFGCGAAPACAPTNANEDYFSSKGILTIRLPFLWQEVQPTLGGALDASWTAVIDGLVSHASGNGQRVVLDVHNFGQFGGIAIGQPGGPTAAQFADLWSKLSSHYKSMSGVYAYDIMNEPCCGILLSDWQAAAQAATNAIRATGDTHLILVEGIGFSAAPQWVANNNTLIVTDPMIPPSLAYDAHAYADADNSGTYPQTYAASGVTASIMADRMSQPIGWASTNSRGAMIHGEGGVPYYDPNWIAVLANFYAYMSAQNEPSLYWADGTFGGTYPLNPSPSPYFMGLTIPSSGVRDRDQMAVFTTYTGAVQPTTFYCAGPAQGGSGLASANFVCKYEGNLTGTHIITPSAASGTFSPSTVTLAAGMNPSATLTYTPASAGSKAITFTDSGGLTSAMGTQTYTSIATSGLSPFEYMPSPVLFAWAPFKLISTYSATGNSVDMTGGDATVQTFALTSGSLTQSAITTFCNAHGTVSSCRVTRLYDQSGNGNDCVPFAGRFSPVPVINGQNSLLTLSFPSGASDTGCASSASITGQQGVSIFDIVKPQTAGSANLIAAFANSFYYPQGSAGGGTMTCPFVGVQINAGLSDTTQYHESAMSVQGADLPNATNTYLDGSAVASGPCSDAPMPLRSDNNPLTLDVGFFRFFSPDGYSGSLGQMVMIGGAASAADATRAHTFDVANWGTP